jgi:predicted enzyme related to lactoylglutathione lyase
MSRPVVFFEVLGKDGSALRSFYAQLFDWSFNQMGGDAAALDYGIVAADGHGIEGGVGTAPPGSPGHVTFYVATGDVAGSLEHAQTLGGSLVMAPMELPGGGIVGLFADPEGHTIGLVTPAAAAT